MPVAATPIAATNVRSSGMDPSTVIEVTKFEVYRDWADDDQVWVLATHCVTIDGISFMAHSNFDVLDDALDELRRISTI